MSFIKTASVILSAISATVVMSALGANKANALSEVSLPSTIMIKSAHSNMVVDKYGDNPSIADKAHLYSQENPATFTLRPIRSANGSYETQLASRSNLCFTAAGGLNPNMGNGTQAVFSGDCANSLNLRFYDDGTVRIGRNTGMCLTNQGNRYNTLLNKLHFWACDGSPETKWNFVAVGNPGSYTPPAPVVQQYNPPAQQVVNNPVPQRVAPNFGATNTSIVGNSNSNATGAKKYMGIAWNMAKNSSVCFATDVALFKLAKLSPGLAINIFQQNLNLNVLLAKGVCALALPGGGFSSKANLAPVYHVYPNNLDASWNEASDHCVATYSAPSRPVWLVWNQDVKKCVGHD
jgi:hypothetical protein